AVEELGYQPHPLARSLIRGRTESIGLMVSGLQNPFFVELLEQAVRAVSDSGYAPILNCGPSVDGTYGHHSKINQWLVDGVIMWCEGSESIADYLHGPAGRLPVCYLSSHDREDDHDLLELDLVEGARSLARHIIDRGYRRVAYVTPYARSDSFPHRKRQAGFHEVFDGAEIAFETMHFPTPGPTRFRGYQAGIAIASMPPSRRPEVVICHNDITAVGLLSGFRRSGARVPNDIAVTGFDGIDEVRWLARPLTTVAIPVEDMCVRAVKMLIERIEGFEGPRRHEMIVPQLRIGGTT
ncbi:MAG TPA: LacI family DNA-binding transcriptional regulator, partial [Fimbriimonas sp.]